MSAFAEARDAYRAARRRGLKESAVCRARGGSGYLAVPDVRREECGVLGFVSQAPRAISLHRIAGTYQVNRAASFAPNFMPILSENSEFASKWIALYASHIDTGIRDAVRVYEYLWKYYVSEGNKRVSVLKYVGASAFEAEVTRLIPQYDEDNSDTVQYYAFLEYAKTGVFPDIELSDASRYCRLAELERKLAGELGTAEELDYNALYLRFESAYLKTDCTMTLGDAFLEYLQLYGFPTGVLTEELVGRIRLLKPQLDIVAHPAQPKLVLEETPGERPLLSRLVTGHRNTNVVFVYTGGRTQTNWLGAHEQGRLDMQAALGEHVASRCIDISDRDTAYEQLTGQAGDAGLLFAASPSLMTPVLRFALEHPGCTSLIYSRMQQDYRLHTYFGRYYEAMFICGFLAGQCSHSGIVCYITPRLGDARYTSDINAFALGARSARPDIRVLLITRDVLPNDPPTCTNAMSLAGQLGVDVVFTQHYPSLTLPDLPREALSVMVGIDCYGMPTRYIAAPDWNWARFYTAIVKSYLNGSLNAVLYNAGDESPVKSFWWGLGAGVIDVRMNETLTGPGHNLARFLRGSIARNVFNPFHGPIVDREGKTRVAAHSDPSPADVMNMRYLVDFIELVE